MAIWRGLKEASVRGFSKVVIQSNCEAVVKLIKIKNFSATEAGLIIADIVSLLFNLFGVMWCLFLEFVIS